jgi:hypothetical protein
MIWTARSRTALQADSFVAPGETQSVSRRSLLQSSARRSRRSRADEVDPDLEIRPEPRTPGPGAAWSGGRL